MGHGIKSERASHEVKISLTLSDFSVACASLCWVAVWSVFLAVDHDQKNVKALVQVKVVDK